VCDIPSYFVNIHGVRKPSNPAAIDCKQHFVLPVLNVSVIMGHYHGGGTTKLPPLECFYTRRDVDPLGQKHVPY
jgi:hypothetical protein